ncbi:hypothetical protein AVEN_83867-1 [Araneus ventricosus]|uniref:Uncharacterized protein n=1 Tax=Araneus ventricosus TaxID=182803 RepID=A0A4Y2ML03_ARAVE|nr:hypothetical protein AVEN_83867-1 [Araneus ventricosus]
MDFVILSRGQMTGTTNGQAASLQNFLPLHWEDIWPPMYDLACNRLAYTVDLLWNCVSNQESSGPEVESLPLDYILPWKLGNMMSYQVLSSPYGHRPNLQG